MNATHARVMHRGVPSLDGSARKAYGAAIRVSPSPNRCASGRAVSRTARPSSRVVVASAETGELPPPVPAIYRTAKKLTLKIGDSEARRIPRVPRRRSPRDATTLARGIESPALPDALPRRVARATSTDTFSFASAAPSNRTRTS